MLVCRMIATDGRYCELEEYGDHPPQKQVDDRLTIDLNEIAELRWRSSGELTVTVVQKALSRTTDQS